MLLVKPSTKILYINIDALQLIELAGRTCYKSENRITETSAAKFVDMIIQRGHESVLEHATATVRFVCDRGVSHEIVRHRIASFSQESTRYCDYEGGHVAFVIPPWVDVAPGELPTFNHAVPIAPCPEGEWVNAMGASEMYYKHLREAGWRPEQARSVLPNSLKTEIVMTANLREWRHFFKLRTAAAAHPQMREVATPLLKKFQVKIPILFDDIQGVV